jgi:diguanylate cyclase (GGDEF)-like protein
VSVATYSFFDKAWRRLARNWEDFDASDDSRAFIKRQQSRNTARNLLFANPGYALGCILVLGQIHPSLPLNLLVPWCVAMALIASSSYLQSVRLYFFDASPTRYTRVITVFEGAFALGIAAMLAYALGRVPPDQQALIVGAFVGIMAGGCISLSAYPPAGLFWCFTFAIMGSIGLLAVGQPVFNVIFILLVVFSAVTSVWCIHSSRNILERLRAKVVAEEQSKLTALLLRDFEGSARDWLWEVNCSGRLQRISSRLLERTKLPLASLENAHLTELVRSMFLVMLPDTRVAIDQFEKKLAEPIAFRDHILPVEIEGELRWWSMTAHPIYDGRKNWIGWRGVGADVTDTTRREQDLSRLANVDSLTGLASRHNFYAALAQIDFSRTDTQTGLLLIDLDNFKAVNDTLGHAAGDQLLQQVAQRLAGAARSTDLLARLGGDEYALLIREADPRLDLHARAQAFLSALEPVFNVNGAYIEVRGSVGAASAPLDAGNSDALMQAADAALYAAKDSGRNIVYRYDRELALRAQTRASLTRDLAHALDRNEFVIFYQPQVSARSGALEGFEALLRWQRPGHGMVPPAEFIAIAEETGRIVPIGMWVLRTACFAAKAWASPLQIAVNLSASQFASRTLLEDVSIALRDANLPAHRLELEITESALIEDRLSARETLLALRALGVRVSIDDFGTGYSSLSYLGTFPLDRLKIDRSFLVALDCDPEGQALAILKTIIQLAAGLNLATTAEGVETAQQQRTMQVLGVTAMQGFAFARPMSETEVPPFMKNWVARESAAAPDGARLLKTIQN